jgi:hypothetical protein
VQAVQVVDRAVEGIDDPEHRRVAGVADQAAFLAEYRVGRARRENA